MSFKPAFIKKKIQNRQKDQNLKKQNPQNKQINLKDNSDQRNQQSSPKRQKKTINKTKIARKSLPFPKQIDSFEMLEQTVDTERISYQKVNQDNDTQLFRTFSDNRDDKKSNCLLNYMEEFNMNVKKLQHSFMNENNPFSMRSLKKNDFITIKQLGMGNYSTVYLAIQKKSGFICALKKINILFLKSENITQQLIRQIKIQMYLDHPNIVKLFGCFAQDGDIYIILQAIIGQQLHDLIKRKKVLTELRASYLMKQVCQAVKFLHDKKIIHRDLKPQNVVLHQSVAKLCDFGWSVYQQNKLRSTFCGTPLYVCPQILTGRKYDQKVDIWSLGVILYEMLIGESPFKISKQQEMVKIIQEQLNIPEKSIISKQAKILLESCLNKNPQNRPSINQILDCEFIKKYKDNNSIKGKLFGFV